MLLGKTFIRGTHLVLEDVNGKDQESMPLEDAITLMHWLVKHQAEIQQAIKFNNEKGTQEHDI